MVCHEQLLTVSIIPVRILHCQSGVNQFSVSVFDNDLKVFGLPRAEVRRVEEPVVELLRFVAVFVHTIVFPAFQMDVCTTFRL